jgi:acetyl esterase
MDYWSSQSNLFSETGLTKMSSSTPITTADRIARVVLKGFSALPTGLQRAIAGKPIVIDGQELNLSTQLGLRLISLLGGESFETKPVPVARDEVARQLWMIGDPIPIGEIRDFKINGPHGLIPVRLYRPVNPEPNTPLLVYYHGGGWTVGDLGECDSVCRFLAKHGGISVLSVDYRLAPEHRFPKGLDDCLAAFDYAANHARDMGCDPALVGVAGESAGGNITAVVSQITTARARKERESAVPAFQIPIQPVTDLSMKRPSYQLFANGFGLTDAQMDWYKGHYLASPSLALDPRVSPILADDLSGLPPALVVVAGFDPLRDEAIEYAQRMRAAGVPVTVRLFPGSTHAELNATGVGNTSREALFEIVGAMKVLIGFARTRIAFGSH